MENEYGHELQPILHRILEASAQTIHLGMVPNWPRDSLPKSPIVQKLGLIVISSLYPWWCRDLEIEYEQFGPYSAVLADVFEKMLEDGQCLINEDYLEVVPSSFEEKNDFPEITELFIQKLISYSNNPVLEEFETIELFSIIAVEHEALCREMRILRRITSLTTDQKKKLISRTLQRMRTIPHLNSFILERGKNYALYFISETIDAFYEAFISYKLKEEQGEREFL